MEALPVDPSNGPFTEIEMRCSAFVTNSKGIEVRPEHQPARGPTFSSSPSEWVASLNTRDSSLPKKAHATRPDG
jgi:hypothetical protein